MRFAWSIRALTGFFNAGMGSLERGSVNKSKVAGRGALDFI